MATASKNPYEFCQFVDEGRRLRCVGGIGHAGSHDLQGPNSASVRAIEQREFVLGRLGYDKPEVEGQKPAEQTQRAKGEVEEK